MTTPPCSNRFAALQRIQTDAYRKAPAIRDIYERANMAPADLYGASDLARLPVTTKDQLLALQREHPPFGGFLSADARDIRRIFVSPGPIYEPELSSDITGRGFAQVFSHAGIGPGDRVLNTWSYHLVPAGLLLDQGIASTGATIIPCGPGGAEQQAQLILELGITCSVYESEPEADAVKLFTDSLQRFQSIPAETLVLPSHGLPFTGLHTRIKALSTHHEERLNELMAACAERPLNAHDAMQVLFRREMNLHQTTFAMGESIAHLNRLWHEGRLHRIQSAEGIFRFHHPPT